MFSFPLMKQPLFVLKVAVAVLGSAFTIGIVPLRLTAGYIQRQQHSHPYAPWHHVGILVDEMPYGKNSRCEYKMDCDLLDIGQT
jgi:hypothetical protein